MAKINDTTTYPNTTPVLTDHVPGTDVSNTGNDAAGETVTFTLQAIMDLFEANFAAPADFIDAITEIAAALKTGSDGTLVTGTAGDSGDVAVWDANGDAVEGAAAPSGAFVGTSDTQTLTNKTINGDNNTLSNLDLGNEVDWAAATDVTDAGAFESGDKVLVFEAGVGMRKIDYDDLPGAGGGLSNVVEDTTPQLGGDLDVNGNGIAFTGATVTDVTGADTLLVSGTAGTSGDLAAWNADGDLIDGPTPPSGTIVGTTDTQTLTNKTLTSPIISHNVTTDADNYTLVAGNASGVVLMSSGSANQLTIPTNAAVAFAVGTKVEIWSTGAGTTTIAGDTGVTLQGNGGSVSAGSCDIQTQYGGATLTKVATNTWLVGGNIDTVS